MGKGGYIPIVSELGDTVLGGKHDMLDSSKMLGGSKPKPKPPAAPGGPGGDTAMSGALDRQTKAQLDLGRMQMDTALKTGKMQTDAAIKQAQMGGMAGIIGAALGANTTHQEKKQWLPHEVGAAAIASHDLAEKWKTTLDMKTAGYSATAIDYALSGKSGKKLWSDPQWNAMKMVDITKRDTMSAVAQFGVQSESNPTGIPISEKDFMDLHSYKDPRDILEVEPEVAAQRQQAMVDWKKKMYESGQGLIVDLYENPQLGANSIESMKGKDALLDPSLAGMMKLMNQNVGSGGGAPTADRGANNAAMWRQKFSDLDVQYKDKNSPEYKSAHAKLLFDKSESDMSTQDKKSATKFDKENGIKQGAEWDKVIGALTKGEKNQYTDEIKRLKEIGVIDEFNMVNAGELMKHIPPELANAPDKKITKDLSPEQALALKDQYNQFASMKVDPKLIREQNMGAGVIKKIKLNPDGTIASQAMVGSMTDAMGNEHRVTVEGGRLQDFYDRYSMIDGKGPTFPGMRAPITDAQRSGRQDPGLYMANLNATPNMGNTNKPGMATPMGGMGGSMASMNPYQASSVSSGGPANMTLNFGVNTSAGNKVPSAAVQPKSPMPNKEGVNTATMQGQLDKYMAPLKAGG